MHNETDKRLEEFEMKPKEGIGQYFLVDEEALNVINYHVIPGSNVLEVGPGTGNITEQILPRAKRLVAVELDPAFDSFLDPLQQENPNLEVLYSDIMGVNLRKLMEGKRDELWQVVANIPFHISEPFLKKMAYGKLPIEDMILVLGDNLVKSLFAADTDSVYFNKTGLLGRSFFDITQLHAIRPEGFYPPAHTAAAVIQMVPHARQSVLTPKQMIYQALFRSEQSGATVAKVLKETIDQAQEVAKPGQSKSERHRQSRRDIKRYLQEVSMDYNKKDGGRNNNVRSNHPALKTIQSLGIPEHLLSIPFSRFTNTDVKGLVQIIDRHF